MAVNCAAFPVNLAESELFGHERGAFIGAEPRHIGRFEMAKGDTIFLDESNDVNRLGCRRQKDCALGQYPIHRFPPCLSPFSLPDIERAAC